MDFPRARLHEHFHDACRTAEISVDLKGRMSVEQVFIASFRRQKQFQYVVSMVAIAQPRPKIDAPADTPPRRVVPADLQGTAGGGGEFGRFVHVDLPARIKAVEMRDMAVMHLRRLHVPVFEPFLQLAIRADPVGRKARQHTIDVGDKIGLSTD